MGILKALGKAALMTTGTASAILKGFSDAAGLEVGSEIFGAAKDASLNGARSLGGNTDKLEGLDSRLEGSTRKKMAQNAKDAANLARKNGNYEEYEHYMALYEQYKD